MTTKAVQPIAPDIKKKIKLFPNPAQNEITIESELELTNGKATIYNLNGQKMIEITLNNNSTQIDTSGLIVGVYVVKITSADNVIDKQKLIIQK
jgi:hypothetical protein